MPVFRSVRIRPGRRPLTASAAAAVIVVGGVLAAPPVLAAGKPGGGATSASPSAAFSSSALLTEVQAAARAKSTGKPVIATALTTATSQTTANPNGTYTLSESAVPTRAWHDNAWQPLDATLVHTAAGGVAPVLTAGNVSLSPGGSGPLVSLDSGGQVMSLTLPVKLPAPSLSGDSATYADVIPGVDLTVTVATSGAFSDAFTVHNAAAGRDPRLASLLSARTTLSRGLSETTDAHGNITIGQSGKAVFSAPAPYAWDSATGSAPKAAVAAGGALSSLHAPGAKAHVARLGVSVSSAGVDLAVPASLLGAATTAYPVVIDPWYTPGYGTDGWASFGSGYPTDNHWDSTTDPTAGTAQIGDTGEGPGVTMSVFDFGLPDRSTLADAGIQIQSATFGIVNTYSGSCLSYGGDETVDLYDPSPQTAYLQRGNATYSYWSGVSLGSATQKTFANGYDSSCPQASEGFTVTGAITNELAHPDGHQSFVLKADDTGSVVYFKEFSAASANLSITYDHSPSIPSGLDLSTGNGCGSTLGDSATSLKALVSDPDGGQVTTTFDLYKTSTPSTDLLTGSDDSVVATSGQDAVLPVTEPLLKGAAGTSATSFTFEAEASDGTITTTWSNTCSFTFDPTRPGAPGIAPVANASHVVCATVGDTTDSMQPVGTSCAFTFSPPPTATISGYIYQLDQQPPVTVSATGSYTATLTMPKILNTLTVNALSSGGNIGQSALAQFDGTDISPAVPDGSVSNDAEPDLIVPGGQSSGFFPAGLWLAQGRADGTTATNALNIGVGGLGYTDAPGTAAATDWNGAQVISGDFCGLGAQDVMAYFPTGDNAGGGSVDCSDGSSDPLTAGSPLGGGTSMVIPSQSIQNASSTNASQIANAYSVGQSTGIPNLFATIGNQLFLFSSTTVNGFTNDFGECSQDCDILTSAVSPDGTADWQNFVISTARSASGTVDMYLLDTVNGTLYLWTNIAVSSAGGTLAWPNYTTLTYNQYTIAPDWNPSSGDLVLRAGFFQGGSIPDLWAANVMTGDVESLLPDSLTNNPLFETTGAQLSTAAHSWQFQDLPATAGSGTAIATTADSAGPLTLTGSASGAVWHTGDIYSPDAMLNTASDNETAQTSDDGSLTTTGPAVTLGTDFSVAVSVRPNAAAGTVLSQSGTNTAGFTLGVSSGGQWQFCQAQTDVRSPTTDCATGGAVQNGVWATLTATYSAETGLMILYVDGVQTASAVHGKTSGLFTGTFHVGDALVSGAYGSYYSGQVAGIQAWEQTMPPAQPTTAGGVFVPMTPFRMVDTRSGLGGTTGPILGNTTFSIPVAGTGSGATAIPSSGVTAIAATVTTTSSGGGGDLIVYPDGTPIPITSNLNYSSTANYTNGVIAQLGSDGKIAIDNQGYSTQVIIDVTGYFTTNTTASGASTYTPQDPWRLVDTRDGTGGVPTAKIAGGHSDVVTVASVGSMPANVSALALNLTAADATGSGQIEAFPDGVSTPGTTEVSYASGVNISAFSVVPVGTDGKIDIYNTGSAGIDAVVDVTGYFTPGTGGQYYHPFAATRMIDTRQTGGALASGTTTSYTETLVNAYDPTLVANITSVAQSANGVLIAWPGYPLSAPNTSSLDYSTSTNLADMAFIEAFDVNPTVDPFFITNSGGSTQLIIDVTGFFAGY
jgi:hypothetical protein